MILNNGLSVFLSLVETTLLGRSKRGSIVVFGYPLATSKNKNAS